MYETKNSNDHELDEIENVQEKQFSESNVSDLRESHNSSEDFLDRIEHIDEYIESKLKKFYSEYKVKYSDLESKYSDSLNKIE